VISLVKSSSIFFILALFIVATISVADAQSYVSISQGSRYVCAYMPDGSNLLYAQNGWSRSLITSKKAISTVNSDITKVRYRLRRLYNINSSLRDGRLSSSEIRTYNNIQKLVNIPSRLLPSRKSRRQAAIKSLILKLKLGIRNKRSEIAALTNCSAKKVFTPKTDNTLSFQSITFKGLDGLYVAQMMYLPLAYNSDGKPLSSRWYCIKGPWQEGVGVPRLFTTNPCNSGNPSVPGNKCSQFTPANMYAEAYAHRLFLGPTWEFNNPFVIAAEAELDKFYSGNIVGRPRTSLDDDCKQVP
jgi:hypothetical protein